MRLRLEADLAAGHACRVWIDGVERRDVSKVTLTMDATTWTRAEVEYVVDDLAVDAEVCTREKWRAPMHPILATWEWTCRAAPIQGEGTTQDGGHVYYRQRRDDPAQLGYSPVSLDSAIDAIDGEGICVETDGTSEYDDHDPAQRAEGLLTALAAIILSTP